MQKIEYEITKHAADTFSELVYYCTEGGECSLDRVHESQTEILRDILNARGSEGWEMVQAAFNRDGVLLFWKRPLAA